MPPPVSIYLVVRLLFCRMGFCLGECVRKVSHLVSLAVFRWFNIVVIIIILLLLHVLHLDPWMTVGWRHFEIVPGIVVVVGHLFSFLGRHRRWTTTVWWDVVGRRGWWWHCGGNRRVTTNDG